MLGWQLFTLLALAILAGGGGVAYGLANLAIQLAALLLLAFNREAFFRFWRSAPLFLRLLAGASLVLPALQLIPLPLGLVSALPGREYVDDAMEAIGSTSPFPLSLAPHRTVVALAGLIVPLTILTLGYALPRRELSPLLIVVITGGLVQSVFGIAQVLGGTDALLLYPENPMPGVLFGTFANRNTAGLFCVAALCLALLPRWKGFVRGFDIARFGVTALLVLAVLLTQSRTAIVLLVVPLGLFGLQLAAGLFGRDGAPGSRAMLVGAGVAGILTLGALAILASNSSRIETIAERFAQTSDARMHIWEDAAYSAKRYWPVGAGMGSFSEVFQGDEALENLSIRKAGRAHNDYLELVIEGGLPALVILVGWFAFLAWRTMAARHSIDRWSAWSGSAVLAVIAFQSILDYPLRSQAMLAIAALAIVALVRFAHERGEA